MSLTVEENPNFDIEDFYCLVPDWVNDDDLMKELEKLENPTLAERYVSLTDKQLDEIVCDAEAKGTKRNTKWIVKTIEGKYI